MTNTDWKATLKAAQDKIDQENAIEIERLRQEAEADNLLRAAAISDWLEQLGLPRGTPFHGHVLIDNYIFKMYGFFRDNKFPRNHPVYVEQLYTDEEFKFLMDHDFYAGVKATFLLDESEDQRRATLWEAVRKADRSAESARLFIETQKAEAEKKETAPAPQMSEEETLRLRWWRLIRETVRYFIVEFNEIPF